MKRVTPIVAILALTAACNGGDEPEPTVPAVVTMSAGGTADRGGHTCAVVDGALWCWGRNTDGELGLSDTTLRTSPVQVDGTTWASVSSGDQHTCGVDEAGQLFCWGYNACGRLGIGNASSTQPVTSPEDLEGEWSSVDAGGEHTCGVQADGTLWCWGCADFGELGIGVHSTESGDEFRTSPQQVGSRTDWSVTSTGWHHSCGIADGELYCWGRNGDGELGLGTDVALYDTPQRVGDAADWTQTSAGDQYTCGIRSGQLWCWGRNGYGQLGTGGTGPTSVPKRVGPHDDWAFVVAGHRRTCGLRGDSLWCWGVDQGGWPDVGEKDAQPTPAKVDDAEWQYATVGYGHTCGARTGGELYCWGWNGVGEVGVGIEGATREEPQQISESEAWTLVGNGSDHTTAVDANGGIWQWGWSYDPAEMPVNVPVALESDLVPDVLAAGQGHNCALRSGELWCWGNNYSGELGLDILDRWVLEPTRVGDRADWTDVAGGSDFTCAIAAGELYCWGENEYGKCGVEMPFEIRAPLQVEDATDWTQVSTGTNHACGLRAAGELYCWGQNYHGQLGTGDEPGGYPSPLRVGDLDGWESVSAGRDFTCALRDGGQRWCWGNNRAGQLGIDSTEDSFSTPQQVSGEESWRLVIASSAYACGLRVDDSLWCWGRVGEGTLGWGSSQREEVYLPMAMHVEGPQWRSLSLGYDHLCGADHDDHLWCSGGNTQGQIGDGTAWYDTPQLVGLE